VQQDHKVQWDQSDLKVLKVKLEPLEQQALLERLVHKVLSVLRVQKVHKDLKVSPVQLVLPVRLARLAQLVLKVQLAQ
jgi:hypothetical protein